MKRLNQLTLLIMVFLLSCQQNTEQVSEEKEVPFLWENATVYFMLTDRFNNADSTNDQNYGRKADGATLRSFMGGDIKGVTQKIESGYFDELGVNAIWMTPVVEQIHGYVDEGTGKSYGFHGYWTKDWTALDKNFGDMKTYAEFVKTAHEHGIRVIMDVVLNHTGPVTPVDPQWPENWVRTSPSCNYQNYESTVSCTLVENLPDILTGKEEEVELPKQLIEKWKAEGRYEKEMAELDAFFERTGYPRAPKYYIIKWLADYVREFGIDGFRIDTAKHVEAGVWGELYAELLRALKDWKAEHPEEKLDDNDFYMMGEVYGYSIHNGLNYGYDGDTLVNFYDQGFKSIINFSLKYEVQEKTADKLFTEYADILNNGDLKGKTVVNYLSSHDDHHPFDADRINVFKTANYLMLTPGSAQIYYGDESARKLNVEAEGDAKLRSFMNWDEIEANAQREGYTIKEVLTHYQKLGQFREKHPAVGAGVHKMLNESPYVFKRTYKKNTFNDVVVVSMEPNLKEVIVMDAFSEGTKVRNYYTGEETEVENGKVKLEKEGRLILMEEI